MKRITEYFFNPFLFVLALGRRGYLNWMSDKMFITLSFRANIGYWIDWNNLKTYNEKLQWLKIYDRKELYTMLVDKYLVKDYVAGKIGEKYIIPTIGVWNNPEEIDFEGLPEQFVLKCNHNSGLGMYICKNKADMDCEKVIGELRKGLKEDYYLKVREWPYKNVDRKIIAEKFISGLDGQPLIDYKLMCFGGKVRCTFTVTNRFKDTDIFVNFYDEEWKPMQFERHYKRNPVEIERPESYEEMVKLAEILAEGIPFVRIDFYEVDGRVYFGEMTFFPGGGMEEFTPFEGDVLLGRMLTLPYEEV